MVSQNTSSTCESALFPAVAGRAGNKPSTAETDGATLGGFAPSSSATSAGAPQGEGEDSKAVGAGAAGMSLSKLITSTKKGKLVQATGLHWIAVPGVAQGAAVIVRVD